MMNARRFQRATARLALAASLLCLVPIAMAAGGPALPAVPATAPVPARAASVLVITAAPGITMEQAVAVVQHKTHGTILRASSREYGNATEYRVKVLTPDGHVRVIPVRSKAADPASQPKSKETH